MTAYIAKPGYSDGAKSTAVSRRREGFRKELTLTDRLKLKINETLVHSLSRKPLRANLSHGVVSFTFDDFPASAYRTGGAILERYGVRGTYYASLSLLGGENEGQQMMNGQDILELLSHGHELGCHSYSHISCRGLTRQQIEIELSRNAGALATIADGMKLVSFSYPFGDISLSAKRTVSNFFTTCRGRRSGLNVGTVDLAALNSESLYSRSEPIERTLAAIARNAKDCGWLIFCSHDIATDPSPHGCTPEHFENTVRVAVASGCEVLTMADAHKRLCDLPV